MTRIPNGVSQSSYISSRSLRWVATEILFYTPLRALILRSASRSCVAPLPEQQPLSGRAPAVPFLVLLPLPGATDVAENVSERKPFEADEPLGSVLREL